MKQSKLHALLAIFTMLGASMITGISLAEDQPINAVNTEISSAPVEDPPTVWDKTKDGSARAWDKTKDGSAKAWDKTKEVSGSVWDATREGSARAWHKTKEVSGDVWDATREGSARAWVKTKSIVQGWQATQPESATDSNQETPAPGQLP